MKFKFWLIFGCAVAAVIGLVLSNTSRSESQGIAPTSTMGPLPSEGLPEIAPTLAPLMGEIPSATPSLAWTLTPAAPASAGKQIVLPKQLIQSAGTPVEDFENSKDWIKVAGQAPAANTTDFKNGKMSLRVTGVKTATIVQKAVKWDLSESQAIRFWAYHYTTGNDTYEVDLATRADYSAYFSAQVTSYGKRWNLKQVGRDEFQSTGGATWADPIVGIRFKVNAGQDYSFDSLSINVSTVPVVMIAFDDGIESAYEVALGILKKHGMAATDYVPTNSIGTANHLTVAQLLELQANGWVIGNHTANHVLLKGLPAADQERELSTALKMLTAWGITGGKYVAYPDGKYDTNTLAILQGLGMVTGRTTSSAPDVFPDLNLVVMRTTQDVSGISLAQIKALVVENKKRGSVLTLLFHSIGSGTALDSKDWNAGMFTDVLNTIVAQGETTLTIDQFYTLATESVKVNAPHN